LIWCRSIWCEVEEYKERSALTLASASSLAVKVTLRGSARKN
jgi:hypothetical protein